MKAAAAVAEILKREGVKFLIGYPVNQIIEAAAEADIRTIIVRQERTGLHMADAVSRVTSGDKVGVFAMQHGPGTENSFGGVGYGGPCPPKGDEAHRYVFAVYALREKLELAKGAEPPFGPNRPSTVPF